VANKFQIQIAMAARFQYHKLLHSAGRKYDRDVSTISCHRSERAIAGRRAKAMWSECQDVVSSVSLQIDFL
jgi:hypothetical protein